MSLRTRKDIYSAAGILNIPKDKVDNFLIERVDGENFNRFIVIKDSNDGPYLSWVKVGVSDLYNVEVVGRKENNTHSLLFKEYNNYTSRNDNINNRPKLLFNNNTSVKLNN